jgi:hypothetical protein
MQLPHRMGITMFRLPLRFFAAALALVTGFACAAQPATVRVDYTHSGNALSDQYALERVVIEPLPWPGNTARNFDETNRGQNRVEVVDAKTGDLLYSRGFSTVFGEWRTTDEANKISRSFQESVRLCMNESTLGGQLIFFYAHTGLRKS